MSRTTLLAALLLLPAARRRLDLAASLIARPPLIFLDEPTTGLHFADIDLLLRVLHQLRDAGNTIVVIEHNLDVIKTSDWVIDMGPEGGGGGGTVVAQGTPEDIAASPGSYTGTFLAGLLDAPAPKRAPRRKKVSA